LGELKIAASERIQMKVFSVVCQLIKDESGATAIEYGLIAALISVVAVAALQLTGTNLSNTFTMVATNL